MNVHIIPPIPVATMGERYFAILEVLNMSPRIDKVTDCLSDAVSYAQTEIFDTPSMTFADVAVKLRMLALMAEAGDELVECADLVNRVTDEWMRVYEAEEAARYAAWRASA